MLTKTKDPAEVIQGVTPIYDIYKSYADNIKDGPRFDEAEIPERRWPDESQWIDFLGYRVASPLGVPSGPLLSSRWTTLAAALGFDIVAYKTIRSQAHPGHALPNVIFVDPSTFNDDVIRKAAGTPAVMDDVSITNSFGNPSMPPVFLLEDIAQARRGLKKGQVLIVSVFGSTDYGQEIKEDFIRTAHLAKDAGAHIIEANFSCPNVSSREGCLYMDPETCYQFASAIAKAVAPLPLLIKVGKFPSAEAMKRTLTALARANARGVCGINTISMRILDDQGKPALGPARETGGVCGSTVRKKGLEFVRDARKIIDTEKLDLELAGCGGIVEAEHFDEFLAAGAKVAMTATGMMWNPYLAMEWHNKQHRQQI